jgi:transketolase
MTIFETGDATEIETIMDAVYETDGPVYIRMLRGEVPRLFDKKTPFKPNTARSLSRGTDITLITSGICTEEAMRASAALGSKGFSLEHLHVSTHKPFTDPRILEAVSKPKYGVITMENHTIIGGLGSEVAEVMAENGIGKKLKRIGLKDTYAHGGSRHYLMRKYGLDSMALIKAIEEFIHTSLDISEDDLANIRVEAVHSSAKEEAL